MAILFASHEVSDYDKWIGVMKGDDGPPMEGLQSMNIYRTMDSSRAVVAQTFDTVENAEKHRAFLENPENQAMGEAVGVIFPITMWIVEEV